MLKQCRSCGINKPLNQFATKRSNLTGFAARCKVCEQERCKEYRRENPEVSRARYPRAKALARARYALNKARYLARTKAWQAANPEKAKAIQQGRRARNPERYAFQKAKQLVADNIGVPYAMVPDILAEAKAAQLKVWRAARTAEAA